MIIDLITCALNHPKEKYTLQNKQKMKRAAKATKKNKTINIFKQRMYKTAVAAVQFDCQMK